MVIACHIYVNWVLLFYWEIFQPYADASMFACHFRVLIEMQNGNKKWLKLSIE